MINNFKNENTRLILLTILSYIYYNGYISTAIQSTNIENVKNINLIKIIYNVLSFFVENIFYKKDIIIISLIFFISYIIFSMIFEYINKREDEVSLKLVYYIKEIVYGGFSL